MRVSSIPSCKSKSLIVRIKALSESPGGNKNSQKKNEQQLSSLNSDFWLQAPQLTLGHWWQNSANADIILLKPNDHPKKFRMVARGNLLNISFLIKKIACKFVSFLYCFCQSCSCYINIMSSFVNFVEKLFPQKLDNARKLNIEKCWHWWCWPGFHAGLDQYWNMQYGTLPRANILSGRHHCGPTEPTEGTHGVLRLDIRCCPASLSETRCCTLLHSAALAGQAGKCARHCPLAVHRMYHSGKTHFQIVVFDRVFNISHLKKKRRLEWF